MSTRRSKRYSPRHGRLILFPAWLRHAVPTNSSPEERVSVAFNLMFGSYGERHAALVWEGNIGD